MAVRGYSGAWGRLLHEQNKVENLEALSLKWWLDCRETLFRQSLKSPIPSFFTVCLQTVGSPINHVNIFS
jgi:hypothetical protein